MGVKRILIYVMIIKCVEAAKAIPKRSFCLERSILLGSEKNMAKVVDSCISAFIQLECNFCNEKNDQRSKLWYFRKRGDFDKPREVAINMNTDMTDNRISIAPSHALIITNFSSVDSGIYSCHTVTEPNNSIFTYYLEDVIITEVIPKSGKQSQWKEYKRIKLDPINNKFEKSNEPPFRFLKENFNFTFRVVTVWEPWGPCETGRAKGHSTKRKEGKCRLHPLLTSSMLPPSNDTFIVNVTSFYLKDDYDVSCRSRGLNDTFPELSAIVLNIPEFVEIAPCPGFRPSVLEGSMSTKKGDYKYHTAKIIPEKSHLTLYCPEATLDSNVVWYKDKSVLNSSFRSNMADGEEEPNLTIDSFNSLYILHATKNEQGVFACTVDGDKMQMFVIEVVSKSKILSQEFLRYSIYLGFVLTLSLTCYCAGVFVAWRRRLSFADPLNLRSKNQKIEANKSGGGDSEEEALLN